MKINPDLIQEMLPMTEDDARRYYAPPRTNGYPRGDNNEGIAMDSILADAGHYGMLCHVSDFVGHNVLPQFPGYGILAGLSQNGLIRAGIEMIADEMTRQWIELTRKGEKDDANDDGEDDVLAALTAEMERLNIPKLFREAHEMCGYYGGCLVYIDTGDDDPTRLLNPLTLDAATFRQGSLKGFKIIEPFNIAPGLYNASEPWSPTYFKPSTWWILGKQIHASRFLYFTNNEVPTLLRPAYNFFGISTTQIVLDAVKHFTDCREAEARLLSKFSMTVLKTNMSTVLSGGGREELDRRIQFMVQHRTNDGVLAINNGDPNAEGEDIVKLETPLSGVTDIVRQSMEIVSAYFSEPATKLWGISPAGFNATGESDMTNHYDHIASQQEKIFHAPLLKVLKLLQINLFGTIDDKVAFTFKPLGVDDGLTQANVQKIKADTDAVLTASGVLDPTEVRTRLANDPDSGYNDIDVDAVPEEMGGLEEESFNGEGNPELEFGKNDESNSDMAQDAGDETWITTKTGSHILLDDEGNVKAGAGGKLNGKNMKKTGGNKKSKQDEEAKSLNESKSSPQTVSQAISESGAKSLSEYAKSDASAKSGTVTAKDILNANRDGLDSKDEFWDMYTPELQVALMLGRDGIDLSQQPVVTGYRYGKAPDLGISTNYRENKSERGLSMASVEGSEELGSTQWFFAGRKKEKYTGVLLPYTGTDDEPLILPINLTENAD